MAQYYQIVQNIDELKRLYPDLNMDSMQVVQVTGDEGNTQARSQQVVYRTTNQNQQQQPQQQQQSTQYVLQDDTVHHHQQQQQQQQQQPQHTQHVYHQVQQQEQRHQLQHHQPHQNQQQIYYTSEMHSNTALVQHPSAQQPQHQHVSTQQTHQTTQSPQQIVYRMPVPVQQQQQNAQPAQQILNNAHVIVQQSPPQVLIQTQQGIHQPIHQQRILYSPNRTVMYTHQAAQQQQDQQHLLQAQEVGNQQQQHASVAPHQHVQMQQPRLAPHPRPIVSATQQPSQNVIFHQVQGVQSVGIQQPQGVISSQLRSTVRTKIPRGALAARIPGTRAATPIATNSLETQKVVKPRSTPGGSSQRGGRGRTVRGRGGVATTPRNTPTSNVQLSVANSTNPSTPTTHKTINPNPQQLYKLQTCEYIENTPTYSVSTPNSTTVATNNPVLTTAGTSTQNTLNIRYRAQPQKIGATAAVETQTSTPNANYQSNMDLEESIQAVVVKKTQEQPQTTTTGALGTTLTTYYTEDEINNDRILKNGTCRMTLSEFKRLHSQSPKVQPMRPATTTAPASIAQKIQISNANQSATPTLPVTVARTAIQQQQKVGETTTPITPSPSVLRTSHNNYEIQTQHVIQNRSLQQLQNYSEKDKNSAKMLVILASGEQRLITFTLPRESCTVQDLLEQVGVPFDDKTTIQCVESPGANIDFVVTVGFSVQESASELILKAEESIQMSRQQETAAAAAAIAAGVTTNTPLNTVQRPAQAIAASNTPNQTVAVVATTTTDDASKDQSNKLGEDIPRKIIQGFLAVCQYCGFCGYDHAKCERCKQVFADEPRRMPCNKNNVANQNKMEEEKKRTLPTEMLNRVQNKTVASLAASPVRGGRSGMAMRGRTRSGRARPTEIEPVILTLSSDDEGDDEQSNKSANKVPVNNTVADAGKPFAFEPNVGEVDEARVYADFRRENVADIDSSMDNLYTTITCKLIRIGTHRFESKDPVTFTKKGIRILAPNCTNLTDVVSLDIYKEEIIKIVAFFSKSFSVMFVYIMRKCCEYVRETLEMKPKNTALETPYFNTTGKAHPYNKIIFQIDTISEESINVIRSLYKSITLEEIQFNDANELLLQAAAKDKYVVNANSNEIRLDPNDIRQILIYPPGKGGISINTEDYMCLATDQYLNDVIIDFYLKWLHKHMVPEKDRERTYIFSSFFYKRLTTMSTRPRAQNAKDVKMTAAQKRHARVANWTKNVNLFNKDYIIIPINELSHWFLAIICFPTLKSPVTFETNEPIVPQQATKKKKAVEKKISLQIGSTTITPLSKREEPVCLGEDDSERDEAEGDESDLASDDSDFDAPSLNGSQRQAIKQPVILIFDSLAGASRSRVVATLRDYLTCEYHAKVQDNPSHTYNKTNMQGSCVKVPQQNNFTDCGLFLLQYVEHFFAEPIRDYTLPIKQLVNWFDTIVVTRKREEISNLLTDLIREHNPNQLPLPKIPFPTLDGELLERPDESFSEDQVEFEEEEMEEDGLEEDDTAETESSPEEPPRVEKSTSVGSITLSTPTMPALGRKIVLKRSFSGVGMTVNVRKTPKLD